MSKDMYKETLKIDWSHEHKEGGFFTSILSTERMTESDACVGKILGKTRERAMERAKRIVKAVNSHDQLVEALKGYKWLYESIQPAGGWQGVYDIGNTALKAAGEKV